MTEHRTSDRLVVPTDGTWETLACGITEIVLGDITPEQEGGSDTSQLLGEAAVNQVLLGVWLRLADNVVRVVVGPDCLQITNHLTLEVNKEGRLVVNNGYVLNGTKRLVPRLPNHAGHGRYHPLVKR